MNFNIVLKFDADNVAPILGSRESCDLSWNDKYIKKKITKSNENIVEG